MLYKKIAEKVSGHGLFLTLRRGTWSYDLTCNAFGTVEWKSRLSGHLAVEGLAVLGVTKSSHSRAWDVFAPNSTKVEPTIRSFGHRSAHGKTEMSGVDRSRCKIARGKDTWRGELR